MVVLSPIIYRYAGESLQDMVCATVMARSFHADGTLVPSRWHSRAIPMAQGISLDCNHESDTRSVVSRPLKTEVSVFTIPDRLSPRRV